MAGPIKDPNINQQQKDTNIDLMDVADFLFGVRSIERIAKGEGSWGDLINVGVTAATFFIPPARLLKLSGTAIDKVRKGSKLVIDNPGTSEAAKRAAQKTLDSIDNALPKKEYSGTRSRYEELPEFQLSPDELEAKKIAERFKKREPEYQGLQKQTDEAIEKQLKKDKIFKGSKEQKTAEEIESLQQKTLTERWYKTDNDKWYSQKNPPRSAAFGAELDEVLYNKSTLEEMLTLSSDQMNREITGKVVGVLRAMAQKETNKDIQRRIFKEIKDVQENKTSSWMVEQIQKEVARLNKRSVKLQEYIDNPTSESAIAYGNKFIARYRRGKYDPVAPRSYVAKESVRKPGKAPDSPQRSTLSELKDDEKSIMNLLEKETDPNKLTSLRADLKRTREEMFNVEVNRGRQYIDDTANLQKQLNDLRNQWSKTKNKNIKLEIQQQARVIADRLAKLEGK